MKSQQLIASLAIVFLVLLGAGYWYVHQPTVLSVTSFTECVAAGNPVMESNPRQCVAKDGRHFTEEMSAQPTGKENLIRVTSPSPGSLITNPVMITGEARGTWFFEASFPVYVADWDGLILGEGHATANGEWMTSEFVPFTAVITFDTGKIRGNYSNKGILVLKKDNPSGLPEHDDALEIPVLFTTETSTIPPTPKPADKGTVKGTVFLGPTCPVEKDPPDPECSPKTYATTIRISMQGVPYATITTNAAGAYTTILPIGTYIFLPKGGANSFPYCSETQVVVIANTTRTENLDCDTGIR
ncbi:MAG TPA: Gmad2 immunoglobulin-like domain-containing protein [Candidatus Paceibacterota bacterium]